MHPINQMSSKGMSKIHFVELTDELAGDALTGWEGAHGVHRVNVRVLAAAGQLRERDSNEHSQSIKQN